MKYGFTALLRDEFEVTEDSSAEVEWSIVSGSAVPLDPSVIIQIRNTILRPLKVPASYSLE